MMLFLRYIIIFCWSSVFCYEVIDDRCHGAEEIVSGLYNPLAVEFLGRWMLIAEHRGVIRSFDSIDGRRPLNMFLNITDRVLTSARPMDERGLLGFALDPRFISNHYFYVFYSTATTSGSRHDHDSVISRFRAKQLSGYWQAIKESELEIIRINQPHARQNGGQIFFGPNDGYLYITTGDGGDRRNARFHKNSLLGKILRVDVRRSTIRQRYSIPANNPFVNDSTALQEVYAYGFRNPWRCTIDNEPIGKATTMKIYCGDLGEPGRNEEDLNLVVAGGRYGWLDDPGAACHTLEECSQRPELVKAGDYLPIHTYLHDEGQAIIGGIVYRGRRFPRLDKHYIYGDYVHGTFHTLMESVSGTWLVEELCVTYMGDKINGGVRHILGIIKMNPDDILILTNTGMTNNVSTGAIFKLTAEKLLEDVNNGCESQAASMMITLAVAVPIWTFGEMWVITNVGELIREIFYEYL